MKKMLRIFYFTHSSEEYNRSRTHPDEVKRSLNVNGFLFLSRRSLRVAGFPLIFSLLSLFLLSCSDPKLDNPFDPESNFNTAPMQGQLALTQLTDNEVKLDWQLNTTIVGNYIIKRQINSGGFEVLATLDKDTSIYTDKGLPTTNTYYYQVIGANGDVQTEPISNSISTTFAVITNFNIQQENLFTAKLTWQHNCSYEDGYIIERQEISSRKNTSSKNNKLPLRRGDAEGRGVRFNEKNMQKNNRIFRDFIQIADLTANTLEYIDDTVLPNHYYEYRIHAYTSLNESTAKQNQILLLFPSPDNFEIEQNDVHTFTLTWADLEMGEQNYVIERKIDEEEYGIIAYAIQPGTESYTDDINLRNTFETVYYKIYAQYESEASEISQVSSNILFEPIIDLTYDQLDIHTIQLNWSDTNLNEDGFNIEKKIDLSNWEFITTITDTTYIDEIAEIDHDLQYRIQVYSGLNATDFVETGVIDNTFPAPTNLTYDQLTIVSIELDWNDNSAGEDGFKIDKKVGADTWQMAYATLTENTETWTDTNAEINEDIQYRVYAYSGNNQSASLETGVIDNTFPAPTNLTYDQLTIMSIELNWDDNSNGEDGFNIEKKVDTGNWEFLTSVTSTTFIDNAADINHDLQYRVQAYSGLNSTGFVETDIIDNTFPAPTNLMLLQTSWTSCVLTWDYYGIGGEEGFKIKRRLIGGSWTEIAQLDLSTLYYEENGLTEGETYEYQVYAYYSTYIGHEVSEILELIASTVTDFDGNIYQVVQIGNQYWMAENLKVTHYRNGDEIENVTDNIQWADLTTGAYCYYSNNSSNGETYGALYNWYAVEEDETRGLAPECWRIPTDEEIKTLEIYLGMNQSQANSTGYRGTNEGSKLAGNAELWIDGSLENDPEFGSSGFDFLPGGYRSSYDGYFGGMGTYGSFWSATEYNTGNAWRRALYYDNTQVSRFSSSKRNGYSVHCIRD